LPAKGDAPNWKQALRQESAKWGLFLTMIIFTVLLVDRVAEILAVASPLLWLLLKFALFHSRAESFLKFLKTFLPLEPLPCMARFLGRNWRLHVGEPHLERNSNS
jgi:hypothetical protein